jgi:hypothetical protein
MKSSLIFLLLLSVQPLSAIGDYQPGDTLYIWAISGLTLREGPSKDAAKMITVPYGTALVVQNYAGNHGTTIEAVPGFKNGAAQTEAVIFGGDFAAVTFKGKTGYVFDGYLSKMPALRYITHPGNPTPVFEDHVSWATRNFGLLRHTQTGVFEYGSPHASKWVFGNGITIDIRGEKNGWTRVILPDASMEEAFLVFSYLWNYEWRVRHPSNNPADEPWHFKKINDQEWIFPDGICGYTIRFLPEEKVAILTSECSC